MRVIGSQGSGIRDRTQGREFNCTRKSHETEGRAFMTYKTCKVFQPRGLTQVAVWGYTQFQIEAVKQAKLQSGW